MKHFEIIPTKKKEFSSKKDTITKFDVFHLNCESEANASELLELLEYMFLQQ